MSDSTNKDPGPSERSRDLRPFYEREGLTKSEWLAIARVVDFDNIPPERVFSPIVAKSMIADATKERKNILARSGSVLSDMLLSEEPDVAKRAAGHASERAIIHILKTNTCYLTGKNVDTGSVISGVNFDSLSSEAKVEVVLSPLVVKARISTNAPCTRLIAPDLILKMISPGTDKTEAQATACVFVMRELAFSTDAVVHGFGQFLSELKNSLFNSFMKSIILLLKERVLSEDDVARILEGGMSREGESGYSGYSGSLIVKVASMMRSAELRNRVLGTMIGFGSGNDVRYQERDGYSFIAMENGDAKRLLETAQHLTGIPLLVTYECLRNSLIKYGMIKTDRDSWKSFSGLPATNRGIVSEQTPDSKYADAAIAILDCPEWLSIVSRVERSFFDNVAAMMEFSREDDDGSDGWRSGRRNSALSLRLYLTGELLLLESRVDYDGISVALTKLKTLFQNKNQNISTNIYSMDVLADFLLQTTPSSQSEKRMRAIELAVSRSLNHFSMLTHGYQKTALETILPHLSASEVIYAMRIFNKKSERQIYSSRPEGRFRLDYDLAQRVAEGLSVEEFWQMTMDDNIEVRMAAYQVASHFIGKRTDVDGNVASVKDLVRIMISGGAVGDKELNAHIAKLCDLGADLSTVAAASSIYKMLDMGTDFDSFDDDALLVAASEFSGLSGIANHSLKKAMIERCKNDKDFLKKVKGVNPRLASEIGSIQGGVAHSEAAQFIKDIIFSKRSHILDYVRGLDQAILDYYVKNILSLIPRSKWSGFFFTSLGKDCQHIIDAVRGVSDLRDDTTPDISGRVRTKEDKREFILNSLAQALQTGRIESTPAGIHNEISQLNKKLRQQNTPLFDVVNPHPAYTSRFAEGVEFVQNDGEQDVTYVAKIISNSHDKLEWGDELNFCLGNESYTNKARTGRYFYIGVYATLKDGRPKKYGVVEIASNWAVNEEIVGLDGGDEAEYRIDQAKLKSNQNMPASIQNKVLSIFVSCVGGSALAEHAQRSPSGIRVI